MYADVRQKLLAKDKILMTEECAKCYIDCFDLLLVVNTPHLSYTRCVPLFPIIYSDRALYTGFSYIGQPFADGTFRFMTAKSLLWGAQLGWMKPTYILAPEASSERILLKNLMAFRAKHRSLFSTGRLLSEWFPGQDVPRVTLRKFGDTPQVVGALWRDQTGQQVLLCVNMDTESHTFDIPGGSKAVIEPLSARYITL